MRIIPCLFLATSLMAAPIDLLLINGEYFTGVAETTGLDSVSFSAVPEPSTYGAISAIALLGLVVYRRRSRQKN